MMNLFWTLEATEGRDEIYDYIEAQPGRCVDLR